MSNNDYMYAIERNDEYLAHYGIKGMKWGVRKAIASGNSRALARQYKKASRKLAKLQARANNGQKYARRAAALGAGAAALGGAAVAGTQGIGNAMRGVGRAGSVASAKAGTAVAKLGNAMTKAGIRGGGKVSAAGSFMRSKGLRASKALAEGGRGLQTWGKGNDLATGAANIANKADAHLSTALINQRVKSGKYGFGSKGWAGDIANDAQRQINRTNAAKGISNNTLARIGAGAAAAGLAGAAGYNAYRAATTKKAAAKATQFQKEMNQAFKGTQYANGGQTKSKKRRRR